MSLEKAEKIARAVLYEGYMLYPYRASALKNRKRCSFGTLYPERHEAVRRNAEQCRNQTECLIEGSASARVMVWVRFLHMLERRVEARLPRSTREFQPIESMTVDDEIYSALDEVMERQLSAEVQISELLKHEQIVNFIFPAMQESAELRNRMGELAGRIIRTQKTVNGRMRVAAERVSENVFRVHVEVTNCTALCEGTTTVMASAHNLMRVEGGTFVSLLDPPEYLREAARTCHSVVTYPVLAGDVGEHDVLLSSPIILYDYPQVAPESAGDFFDATEIDELLTLRIMTLTDDEKREMRSSDEHMRQLLERTESTARDQLMRMHGLMRDVTRQVTQEVTHDVTREPRSVKGDAA
jgi:hydrogenase maturation protease